MVYVDSLRKWPQKAQSGSRYFGEGRSSCHLAADTREELLAFAVRLGLRAEWLQTESLVDHFDLTMNKRVIAVRMGAIEVSSVVRAVQAVAKQHELFD